MGKKGKYFLAVSVRDYTSRMASRSLMGRARKPDSLPKIRESFSLIREDYYIFRFFIQNSYRTVGGVWFWGYNNFEIK
jgi:hypothetical protein